MKTRLIVCAAIAVILALALSGAGQQSAEQLYKSGLYEEEVGGDLQKAIGIYQEILKRFPDSREVAAKALLHIGLCYEKLGNQEALKAYQRLIADYPGQKEEVALAKERLAGLAKIAELAPRKPVFPKNTDAVQYPPMEREPSFSRRENPGLRFRKRHLDRPDTGKGRSRPGR